MKTKKFNNADDLCCWCSENGLQLTDFNRNYHLGDIILKNTDKVVGKWKELHFCAFEVNLFDIECTVKPILGVMPKKLWQENRYLELCRAISDAYNAGQTIQIEWVKEYNDLIATK